MSYGRRLSVVLNRAAAVASYRIHVAMANSWRDQYNPLRSLTIGRAVALLEEGERGAMADLQWTYRFIEMQDATLGALIERRTSAIQKMDWNINRRENVPVGKEAVAEAQYVALKAGYDQITNLKAAFEGLAMASFRGYAHLEKVYNDAGEVVELGLVDQWFWVRRGLYGEWEMNEEAKFGSNVGVEVPLRRFIIRECARPINRVALISFIRKNLSQKDWDGFIESYGIPAVFIIMPPGVPIGKEDEYLRTADSVVSDARGALPHGSDVKTVDNGARGQNPFKDHIAYQDEQMVMRGTGGKLTMLTASGSGTLAGGAHTDTFTEIAQAEAAEISEILRKAVDAEILARATPGEDVYAYFELAANEETDVGKLVANVVALRGAGYEVSADWVMEKTGVEISKAAGVEAGVVEGQTGVAGVAGVVMNRRAEAVELLGGRLFAELEEEIEAELLAVELGGEDDVWNGENRTGAVKGWETRRANGWVPAPRLMTVDEADEELDKGFFVPNREGEKIRFGHELKSKLDDKVVNPVDRDARKQRLNWAKLAVSAGTQESSEKYGDTRTIYAKTFRKGPKHQDVEVIVDTINGYAWNIMVKGGKANAIR